MRVCVVFCFCLVLSFFEASAQVRVKDGAMARVEFAKGMAALSEGRIDVAREAFSKAATFAPRWALAFLQWGITEQSVNPESDVALQCLQQAQVLAPKNARIHFQLGLLFEKRKQLRDAIQAFANALALRPGMSDARFHMANILLSIGEMQTGVLELEKLIKTDPAHTGALSLLAEISEQQGDLERAEFALVAITDVQPNVAYHYYRLGQFYERVGNQRKAKQAFFQANKLDPRPQRKMRTLR